MRLSNARLWYEYEGVGGVRDMMFVLCVPQICYIVVMEHSYWNGQISCRTSNLVRVMRVKVPNAFPWGSYYRVYFKVRTANVSAL